MGYRHIEPPSAGERITVNDDFTLNVPGNPIISFRDGRP